MSHSYRTIPDAKFEFGIFSIFGDMTHKLSLSKRGEQVIEFVYVPLEMGLNSKKWVFLCPGTFLSTQNWLGQFQQKKCLYFKNVLDISRKK